MRDTYMQKIELALSQIEPKRTRQRISMALHQHLEEIGLDSNQDFHSEELTRVKTTLQHLVGLQSWVVNGNYDPNIRRLLKKALTSLNQRKNWEEIVEVARTSRGLANKAGRLFNESKEFGSSVPISLTPEYRVIPLNSIRKMKAAGKKAGNCLSNNTYHYWELRSGQYEFYALQQAGDLVACFSVDCSDREIWHFEKTDDFEIKNLPRPVLWRLCKTLHITADSQEEFAQCGVLSLFLRGEASRNAPAMEVNGLKLWSGQREIVLHDSHERYWSMFEFDSQWQAIGASAIETDGLKMACRLNQKIRRFVKGMEGK